jgi:sugar/nucleoside kinase (ribokinase family)
MHGAAVEPGKGSEGEPAPVVGVVGYLSLDEIHVNEVARTDVPGGAALYAALGARAGGARVLLGAAHGPDFPEQVLDALDALGVDRTAVIRRAHPTRRARLVYSPEGRRQSSHYRDEAWHAATRALAPPLLPDTTRPAALVLTAMPAETLERQITWARAHGARVVVDTSEVFAAGEREQLMELVRRVDLFAPSREETRCLLPELEDDVALLALGRLCPRVVQKRGAEGLALVSTAHPNGLRRPADAATLRDPTGAGDACVGALGAGVARGLDDRALLALGLVVAARAIGGLGPEGLGLTRPAPVRGARW